MSAEVSKKSVTSETQQERSTSGGELSTGRRHEPTFDQGFEPETKIDRAEIQVVEVDWIFFDIYLVFFGLPEPSSDNFA